MTENNINYEMIVKHFLNIINKIEKTQNDILYYKYKEISYTPTEKEIKKAKKDKDDCYWSFERAYDRAHMILKLLNYCDEKDFDCFALHNLNNTRSRINNFLKNAQLSYPNICYETGKYDDIIIDYYNDIKDDYPDAVDKYFNLNYRQSACNLGIVHEIDSYYNLILKSKDKYFEEDSKIILEMIELTKKLSDFKAPTNKKDNYINYGRWQK